MGDRSETDNRSLTRRNVWLYLRMTSSIPTLAERELILPHVTLTSGSQQQQKKKEKKKEKKRKEELLEITFTIDWKCEQS